MKTVKIDAVMVRDGKFFDYVPISVCAERYGENGELDGVLESVVNPNRDTKDLVGLPQYMESVVPLGLGIRVVRDMLAEFAQGCKIDSNCKEFCAL